MSSGNKAFRDDDAVARRVSAQGSTVLTNYVDVVQELTFNRLKDEDVTIFDLVELNGILVEAVVQDVEAFAITCALELRLLHTGSLRRCFGSWLWRMELR